MGGVNLSTARGERMSIPWAPSPPMHLESRREKQKNHSNPFFPICGDPLSPICQKIMVFEHALLPREGDHVEIGPREVLCKDGRGGVADGQALARLGDTHLR